MKLAEALAKSGKDTLCAVTTIWGRKYAVRQSRSKGYQWDLMHLSNRSNRRLKGWITAGWFKSLEEIEQDLETMRGYKPETWEPQTPEVKGLYDTVNWEPLDLPHTF